MMRFLYRFEAMTTPCEILLSGMEKREADRLSRRVLAEVKRLEKKYNYFDPESYLSLLNRREESSLDRETVDLLRRALLYYEKTDRLFDITVGTIKNLHREAKTLEDLRRKQERLLPFVGCEHLRIRKGKLLFDNPYTKLDLGGFVKEYAVDRAAAILRKHHVRSALINFGGDIFALGRKPDGKKYRIGIKDPGNPKEFATFVEIEDEAVTTSASYERYHLIEERRFSHILSREGPAAASRSVSVISPTCTESGVFSTALMIDPKLATSLRTIILG